MIIANTTYYSNLFSMDYYNIFYGEWVPKQSVKCQYFKEITSRKHTVCFEDVFIRSPCLISHSCTYCSPNLQVANCKGCVTCQIDDGIIFVFDIIIVTNSSELSYFICTRAQHNCHVISNHATFCCL